MKKITNINEKTIFLKVKCFTTGRVYVFILLTVLFNVIHPDIIVTQCLLKQKNIKKEPLVKEESSWVFMINKEAQGPLWHFSHRWRGVPLNRKRGSSFSHTYIGKPVHATE